MKITVIGGTGFSGAPILKELLSRGHEVTAIVRRADAELPDKALTVLVDVFDTERLAAAFAGTDAVVSAYNPGWQDSHLYENFMSGSRSIQRAAIQAKVPRLLIIGGSSSLLAANGTQLYDTMHYPPQYEPGVRAAKDYLTEVRSCTEIDWVVLSPPPNFSPLGPKGRRGTYRVGADHPVTDEFGHSEISQEDLAIAVVDELETPHVHRARFTIGY